ncbi:MAG: NUDIX hydrolase [Ruminococcaceae bacterium]|nr:NUDIX hydrolase [Oscillospiraceae bacterium]
MRLEEKNISSRLIYDGKVVHLYEDEVLLPDGQSARREYVKHIGAVCVLALTDQGEVILERQFRYPFHKELIEIPAGKLDSADEDPKEAALRELREETGYVPTRITYIGDFYSSPAILDERIRMFFAEGLMRDEQQLDDDEFLEVFTMPLKALVDEILAGHISDGKTQAAALKVYTMLQQKGRTI